MMSISNRILSGIFDTHPVRFAGSAESAAIQQCFSLTINQRTVLSATIIHRNEQADYPYSNPNPDINIKTNTISVISVRIRSVFIPSGSTARSHGPQIGRGQPRRSVDSPTVLYLYAPITRHHRPSTPCSLQQQLAVSIELQTRSDLQRGHDQLTSNSNCNLQGSSVLRSCPVPYQSF
jgi:hypothetical protein